MSDGHTDRTALDQRRQGAGEHAAPAGGGLGPVDTRLDELQRYPLPSGHGPEDVVIDAEGRLVTGTDDGRLWRWPADLPGPVARPFPS